MQACESESKEFSIGFRGGLKHGILNQSRVLIYLV
jgi:hypothetical protein